MDSLRCLVLCMIIVPFYIHSCVGLAEYEMFPGFFNNETKTTTVTSQIDAHGPSTQHTKKASSTKGVMTTAATMKPKILETKATASKAKATTTTERPLFPDPPEEVTDHRYQPYVCPEEEQPLNIGPYEVPTQKDLVGHMKKTLITLFKSYHKKALFFLNDIKEATQATAMIVKQCPVSSKRAYRLCVRHVSNQCKVITKSFVTSLERQRHDVLAFNEASICNVSSMRADPVQLIKTLAMEEVSLEFALPGFLRLLGACSVYCQKYRPLSYWKKPMRHMTDQDLVIKHFLTRKNYAQLIQGT